METTLLWLGRVGAAGDILQLSSNNLLLVDLGGPDNQGFAEQFLALLDCDPEGFERVYREDWQLGDTLTAYEDSSVALHLTRLTAETSVFVLNISERGTRQFYDSRRGMLGRRYRELYFLGARDVTFIGIVGREIILSVLWACHPKPQEIRFSLQSYQPVLQEKTE